MTRSALVLYTPKSCYWCPFSCADGNDTDCGYCELNGCLTDAVEICDERMKDRIEEWKKRKTEESVRGLLFDSREECQSACDIFNEKQGHPEWIYRLDGELLENGKCEK